MTGEHCSNFIFISFQRLLGMTGAGDNSNEKTEKAFELNNRVPYKPKTICWTDFNKKIYTKTRRVFIFFKNFQKLCSSILRFVL